MNAALMAVVTVAMSASLAAQWLNQATPGIPRTADGKRISRRLRCAPPTANPIFPACGTRFPRNTRATSPRT
jgi:hypothetical protein